MSVLLRKKMIHDMILQITTGIFKEHDSWTQFLRSFFNNHVDNMGVLKKKSSFKTHFHVNKHVSTVEESTYSLHMYTYTQSE